MSQHIRAVYENGVLKPLAPLDLREHAVVTLSIQGPEGEAPPKDQDALKDQQRAIDEFLEQMEQLPVSHPHDGLTGRDHDQVVYGTPQ